jgi:hypothetical protein
MYLEKNNGYDSTGQSDDIRGNIAIPTLSTTYNHQHDRPTTQASTYYCISPSALAKRRGIPIVGRHFTGRSALGAIDVNIPRTTSHQQEEATCDPNG